MTFQADILHAPKRKRKPEHLIVRQRRQNMKIAWLDPKISSEMIEDDIGAYQLSEDEFEDDIFQQPTPKASSALFPSQVHRVPVISIRSKTLFTGDLCNICPVCPQQNTAPWLVQRPQHLECYVDWNDLSDEVILQVFRWLPKYVLVRCMRVCKRWKRIGIDESLWRRLDLSNKKLKQGDVGQALSRGVQILRLTRSEVHTPLYLDHMVLQHRLSKLQYLDVSMAAITETGIEQLLSVCRDLRKLSLENCQLSETSCRNIGNNENLQVLNLSMCQGLTKNAMVPICSNLKRLEELNCAWTSLSFDAVSYITTSLPPGLHKLNLSGCRNTLTDADVKQLCCHCCELRELDLSDAHSITAESVAHVATSLHQLEYLALSRCYSVLPAKLPLLCSIPTFLALDVFSLLQEKALGHLQEIMPNIEVNNYKFSSIARPTTGIRRTSIWGLRVRDF